MYKSDTIAVSPIIGVVLMIAVTAGLVALINVTVFDITDDVPEPADISMSTNFVENEEELVVEVVRNNNVDSIRAQVDGKELSGSPIIENGDVGTAVLDGFTEGDTVIFVATIDDREEIVRTVDIPD